MTTPSLYELPVELTLQIAEFLQPSELACWSLTCRRFQERFGMESWESLMRDPYQCELFVRSLTAGRIPPGTLNILDIAKPLGRQRHQMSAVVGEHSPLYAGHVTTYALGCLLFIEALRSQYGTPPQDDRLERFKFECHAVIKIHTDLLQPLQPEESQQATHRQAVVSITPHIVTDTLLLKVTYSISFPLQQTPLSFNDLAGADLALCPHVALTHHSEPWFDNSLADKIFTTRDLRETVLKGLDAELDEDFNEVMGPRPPPNHLRLRQCCYCLTEYEIDIRGPEIVITAWHSLGDPRLEGPRWAPFDNETSSWHAFVGLLPSESNQVTPRCFPLGSVKDAFESLEVSSSAQAAADTSEP